MVNNKGLIYYENHNKSIRTSSFNNFLKNLKNKIPTNKTLIMDNVSFHKSKIIKETLKDFNVIYTPPFSL